MSVVIIGGHDRMVCQYKKVCKSFNCKAKVFTQMSATLSKQIGNPDLIVLFTNTVSHKMARCAVEEAERCNADVVRCHSSSKNALQEILGSICMILPVILSLSIISIITLSPTSGFIFLFLNIPFALHSYIPQDSIWT